MKNKDINKLKKISGILSLGAFLMTLFVEILRQTVPQYTILPTTTEGILTVLRNIFFAVFVFSFTAFLFFVFKDRFGKVKAVFYTLYCDCFFGFLVGMLITVIAGARNSASFGITPLESIYYYFVGLFVMAISVALILVGMISYAITMTIIARKNKKYQQNS